MEDQEYPQGAAVLDAAERWLRRFVHFPTDAHAALAALWIAGAHMTDENGTVVHSAYGRLGFVSDVPGSGKTTAMERVLGLSPRGEMLVQPSLAGIMDAMDERLIIAIDEADKYFGKSGRMAHVTAFLNAGYKRGGGSVRHRNRKVDSFALVMYSGLSEALKASHDLQPLRTRSFLVEMAPAPFTADVTEYDDEVHDAPQAFLRDAVAAWARSVAHLASAVVVAVPDAVANRRAQLWRPLLRVATLAGGPWPDRAYAACRELESGVPDQAAPVLTAEQRIMTDVAAVLGQDDRVTTVDLVARLRALPDSPWSALLPDATSPAAARELSALLSPHGLEPDILRMDMPEVGAIRVRGYDFSRHTNCPLCPDRDAVMP